MVCEGGKELYRLHKAVANTTLLALTGGTGSFLFWSFLASDHSFSRPFSLTAEMSDPDVRI